MNINIIASAPTTVVVQVTPAMAKEWLTYNTRNRSVSRVTVLKYREDMMHGRWEFDGSPIRFSKAPRLLDGQHRLHALASLEGVKDFSLQFLVILGLEDHSQMVMDQGHKRTPGQQMALKGEKNANLKASIAKHVLVFDNDLFFRDNMVQNALSTSLKEKWISENREHMAWIDSVAPRLSTVGCTGSVVGAAFVLFRRIDERLADEYFWKLVSGEGLFSPDPALAVREYFRKQRVHNRARKTRDEFEVLFRGWNKIREGKTLKYVSATRPGQEKFPMPR